MNVIQTQARGGRALSTRSGDEKAAVRPGTRAAASSTAQERCLWSRSEHKPSFADAQGGGVGREWRRCGDASVGRISANRARG